MAKKKAAKIEVAKRKKRKNVLSTGEVIRVAAYLERLVNTGRRFTNYADVAHEVCNETGIACNEFNIANVWRSMKLDYMLTNGLAEKRGSGCETALLRKINEKLDFIIRGLGLTSHE